MNTSLVEQSNDALLPLLNPEFIKELDVEKTERLFALYEREQERRAAREFAIAMTTCQQEMPNVIKANARNSHTNSDYAKQDAVVRALKPVYMKHGFTISFGEEPCDREGFIIVVATVRHQAGHAEIYRRFAPIDNLGPKGNPVKSLLHGCQSAMSYMQRKLLESIFGIAETDEDDDGVMAGTGTVSAVDCAEISALLDKFGDERDTVLSGMLEWLGVESLEMTPADKVEAAKKNLTRKLKQP